MESRKLIKFGTTSLVISLPKVWLEKNKLKKGDPLYLKETSDNEMVLNLKRELKKEEKQKVIDIANKDPKRICYEITSCFINGYTKVAIKGKNLNSLAPKIKETLKDLIAFEITEISDDSIKIEDFLKFDRFPISEIIRKMDLMVRSMIKTSKSCIHKNKFEEIAIRDADVNKLNFLTYKIMKSAMKDPEIIKTLNTKPVHLIMDWWFVFNIEKIADEAKRIAKFLTHKHLHPLKCKELESLYTKIEDEYLKVMKALYTQNKELAYSVVVNYEKIIKECDDYSEKNPKPQIGSIIEKLKGMATHIRNIARLAFYHE